jgi:glycosyltransferase involved in cell wall biosynthesis
MTSLPRVVACMPTWNAETFVDETLASLAAQTYPNLEILVSDDASADGTPAICERYAAIDPRFRVMRQSTRHGWFGNVNLLLDAARGDYCFFAFHDDPLQPTYVARLVEALQQRPSAVLAFSDMRSFDRVDSYCELDGVSDRVERARRLIRRRGRWWIPNRGLFRLEAARRIGGMRRHLAGEYQADHPWLLRLALLGEFTRVPEPLSRKAYRDDAVSAKWDRKRSIWKSTAVLLAAAHEVRRAKIPFADEILMYKELVRFGVWALLRRHLF